jgi:uncharacterized protein YcfJ
MKTFKLSVVLVTGCLVGCTIPVKVVQEPGPVLPDAVRKLTEKITHEAVITVGDAEYACTIVAVDQERLKVSKASEVREIPLNAIRTVRFTTAAPAASGSSAAAGALIGAVTGGLLGEAAGDKAGLTVDGKEAEIRAAAALGGAILGYFAVKAIAGADEVIAVNPHIKTFTLDKAVGYALTASEMQNYGIFTDLPLKAGEVLLKARVFLCEAGQYLIVYETHNGETNCLNWECVDHEYIAMQKEQVRGMRKVKAVATEE